MRSPISAVFHRTQSRNIAANVLLISVWFGLVTGLLEGTIFLVFQEFGRVRDVTIEILWISAFFDLLLFSMVGFAMVAVAYLFPRLPITCLSVFVCALLGCLDWLAVALAGRIYPLAILALAAGLAVQFTLWFRNHEPAITLFWRKSLPWIAGMALLLLLAIQGGLWLQERIAVAKLPTAPLGSPNILVVVVDTLRADHLSSYGYKRRTSPNMDKLAEHGVLFEHAFATSSYTLPSHASLLTGRYPYEHGVEWKTSRALLDTRHPTLAEALRSRGYRTAAFSANVFWFTRPRGFDRGFIHFEDYFHSAGDMAVRTLYGRAIENVILRRLGFEDIPARKRASQINHSVLRWLDRAPHRPFFVFVNYMDTHDPYLPPPPYRHQFSKLKNPGGILNWRLGRSHPQMTSEQLQGEIDAYDGAIAYVDEYIGLLLAELRERGLGENTLVVITSDHGESFGEHGLYLHGNSLYCEEIQVPLIFWAPGRVPGGARVEQPVTNAALPATVMDLVGAGDQRLFAGPSLTEFWKASEPYPDPFYPLAEIAQIPWAPKIAPVYSGSMKSLVSPQWHGIVHEQLGTEFYEWKHDRLEAHNLAARKGMQGDVALFRAKLLEILSNREITAGSPP